MIFHQASKKKLYTANRHLRLSAKGRLSTCSFLHSGAEKTFTYQYLIGTDLLSSLTAPNNITRENEDGTRTVLTNHRFLYRGYLQIAVLALVYYNYRHYNPLDGRWARRDPLWIGMEFGGGGDKQNNYDMPSSLYKYVNNTPIEGTDILGLASEPFRMDIKTKYCRGVIVASYSKDLKYKINSSSWRERALDGILDLIADQLTGLSKAPMGAAVRGTGALAPYAYLVYVCSCPNDPSLDEKDIETIGTIDVRYISKTTSDAQTILQGKDAYYNKYCHCKKQLNIR